MHVCKEMSAISVYSIVGEVLIENWNEGQEATVDDSCSRALMCTEYCIAVIYLQFSQLRSGSGFSKRLRRVEAWKATVNKRLPACEGCSCAI